MDMEANNVRVALSRAETILESARKLNYQDEGRQKLIEDGIRVAKGALKSVDPNDQVMTGYIYFVLGGLQAECELFDEAIGSFEEALFVRQAFGDFLGAGRAEGNIGGILDATGHLRKAIDALRRAERLFEQAGDSGKEDLNYTRAGIERIEGELSTTNPLESNTDTKRAERDRAIRKMVANIRRGDQRGYFVALVGYYIEGYPYSASGLSVDSGSTPDIHVTENGFACTCTFPPEKLQPATVKSKGIFKMDVDGVPTEAVRVSLEVKSDDIYAIAEYPDGKQHTIFSDVETLRFRDLRFKRETHLWFERRNAKRNAES